MRFKLFENFEESKRILPIRRQVIGALIELGYGSESAINLIEKHIDVYEVNVDDGQDAKSIAQSIEEAEMQSDDINEGFEMTNLYDISDELNDIISVDNVEGEGDDVLRVDYDGGNSVWLYTNGSVDGNPDDDLKLFLKEKGFSINESTITEAQHPGFDLFDLDNKGFYDLELEGTFDREDWTIVYPEDWTRKQAIEAMNRDVEKISSIDIPCDKVTSTRRDGILPYIELYPGELDIDESKSENIESDMKGEVCEECGDGKYTETNQLDDLNGVLHCEKCNHEINRYK